MIDISYAKVASILKYDPDTGKLFWIEPKENPYNTSQALASYMTKQCGKEAFTRTRPDGYKAGDLFGYTVRAHRVAWLLTYGKWPKGFIDHIDGNPANNCINNLREVTQSENMRNARMCSRNTSGYNGVHWEKSCKKWRAKITLNDKTVHIGVYNTKEEAYAARLAANEKHNFTERHGQQKPSGQLACAE